MLSNQMAAVIALLSAADGNGAQLPPAAATSAADALGVDGISAGVGTGPEGIVLTWGLGATSTALDEAGFTLGEGPAHDCVASGAPVLISNLGAAAARWPAFTSAALDLGVHAVFALPLRIGAISVGTLVAHRTTPGSLHNGQLVDALALADTLTVLLVRHGTDQASRSVAEGERPSADREGSTTHRFEVHQATGMISVQLGVSLSEALLRLRAHAYANDRSLNDVAADVVARRLQLEGPHP